MSSLLDELSRQYGMGGGTPPASRDLNALATDLGVASEDSDSGPLGALPPPGAAAGSSSSTSRWASRPVPWTPQHVASVQSGVDRYEPNPTQIVIPRVLDYADAVEYIDVIRRTDPDTYSKILAAMKMGDEPYLSSKSSSRSAVRAAWTEVVKDSALLLEQGQEVTPLQLLGQKVNGTWVKPVRLAAKEAAAGGDGTDPTTRTATSENESVTLTSRSEAERILDSALAQYLGRQATAAEVRRFKRSLNAAEEERPVVSSSETTQTVDGEGNTKSSSSSRQSGGQDPMEAAEDFAKQQEGYGEYQASTTYLDAFRQTLQGDTL